MKDFEFAEYKRRLPIGIYLPTGEKITDFSCITYVGTHDILLGTLEDNYDNRPQGERLVSIYSQFLTEMIASIGALPLHVLATKMGLLSPTQVIGEMYIADVLSMALTLRSESYGNSVSISCVCPCDRKEKIKGTEDPHDMGTIMVTAWGNVSPPYTTYELEDPIEIDNEIVASFKIEPPKFKDIPLLIDHDYIELDIRRICCCVSDFTQQHWEAMSMRDRRMLVKAVKAFDCFGVDRNLEMDCPHCRHNWTVPLISGANYEEFYLTLLSAPRRRGKTVEEEFDAIEAFFSIGEQAPRWKVRELTPTSRERKVAKLSDHYKKQDEEMKKSNAKSKSRRKK